ncbi:hypothetical protein JTB14_008710 [Gonioctena quinquepunctata]|nr:hypothetical protein JTB14_008710 [Gonioctena quinquepunctata]
MRNPLLTTPRQKFSSSGKNPRQEKSYNLAVARQVALEYQLMQGITVNLVYELRNPKLLGLSGKGSTINTVQHVLKEILLNTRTPADMLLPLTYPWVSLKRRK